MICANCTLEHLFATLPHPLFAGGNGNVVQTPRQIVGSIEECAVEAVHMGMGAGDNG